MDASLRNRPALEARIEKLRDQLVARFHTIVNLAAVSQQVKTHQEVAKNAQSLIRQLQEMWLFGQLDTLGDSKARQQSDEDARSIALLLKQLAASQQPAVDHAGLEPVPQPTMVNEE
ncbi:hypothetical protein LTR74_003283 [Friedmanniomyces endolithicus]|nr:hypothetical protein LTR74_003283 [Friedmanniomyces endolithicus]